MTNQPDAFFFEIQPIPDDTILYDQFQQQNIFYSYFQVEQKYYLFFYSQKSIDIDLIEQFIDILEELDTKQRKIRSLRGFFLYALEIMNNEKDLQIFKTNLKPSFWRNLRTILRQNKKEVLLRFLFGKGYSFEASNSHLEDQIQTLKSQVNSLQQKIIELEQNQTLNLKKALSEFLKPSQASKIDQHYNISSNQDKGLNGSNFTTLGTIPEQERLEIIKTGFRLNQEGKISLKKYYESTEEHSLFQLKGYSIKYESIRRTKLYKNLKL